MNNLLKLEETLSQNVMNGLIHEDEAQLRLMEACEVEGTTLKDFQDWATENG